MMKLSLLVVIVGLIEYSTALCSSWNSSSIRSQVTQFGITFVFENEHLVGQFSNGDYWVVGPITLTETLPAFTGTQNGFEINPNSYTANGFDSRINGWDASRVPSLPVSVPAGSSIVKTISRDGSCRPCLEVAAVLSEAPPNDGSTVLRPPYYGTSKPLFSTSDIRYDKLPKITLSNLQNGRCVVNLTSLTHRSLSWVEDRLEKVQLDNKENWQGRDMHPRQNMPDYGSDIAQNYHQAALRLLYSDVETEGTCAMERYLVAGLDFTAMFQGGMKWPSNGGHCLGRKLPLLFSAVMLDRTEVIEAVKEVTDFGTNVFQEDNQLYLNLNGVPVYGSSCSENDYWNLVRTDSDFYRLIDGGHRPGTSYQFCCNSQPWKGAALALHLFPELRVAWNRDDFLVYVHRWVNSGTLAQPDYCAPAEGVCGPGTNEGERCTTATPNFCGGSCQYSSALYGVTYGPDGNGSCVRDTDPSDGIGRFPTREGASADGGQYRSNYVDEIFPQLWDFDPNSLCPNACLDIPNSECRANECVCPEGLFLVDNECVGEESLAIRMMPSLLVLALFGWLSQ